MLPLLRASRRAARGLHGSARPLGRVLLADKVDPVCRDTLEARGHQVEACATADELRRALPGADALIVRSATDVTEELMAAAGPSLKVVGRAGTGVDNVDVRSATRNGILVMNSPGGNTASAAEMALTLVLALSRGTPASALHMKEGRFDLAAAAAQGFELRGRTLGVVGLGRIGRDLGRWAHALGMRVIGFDPILSSSAARLAHVEPVALSELYARSDFVSLHTPLTPETRGMLDAAALAQCKPGVCLVNCARGGVVDEAALLAALKSGHVAAAALDVFASEPPDETSRALLQLPNVIGTPHLGASTHEAQRRVARNIAAQVSDALDHQVLSGVVNATSVHHASTPLLAPFASLSGRLGSLQAQLLGSEKLRKMIVRAVGPDVGGGADTTDLLATSALAGALRHLLEEEVTLANAQELADELGLEVQVQRERSSGSQSLYRNTVGVRFDFESGHRSIVGTVVGLDQLRVVEVDGFGVEFEPAGDLVFFKNVDRPGVLRSVLDCLGQPDVESFALGRREGRERSLGVVAVRGEVSDATLDRLRAEEALSDVASVSLMDASVPTMQFRVFGGGAGDEPPKPSDPNFGSGPCKKRPGYDLGALDASVLGRSHRSPLGLGRLQRAIDQSKALLGLPAGYELGIVPGSDTGAFEMAMWNLLGPRPVDVCYWEAFGKGWFSDATAHLTLEHGVRGFTADYGQLPDLSGVDPAHDVCFTWNGTTSGVRVPDADWIAADREGLTLCDATSAAFAMPLDWPKLDVTTFSFQKVLGGEGGHGVVIMNERALQRLEEFKPEGRPIPKVLRVSPGIFTGSTINTPSMLVIEDYLDALDWAERIGGVPELIRRSTANMAVLEAFVASREWIEFLAADPAVRSSTSVCLALPSLSKDQIKQMQALLEARGVAFDIGSYRDAPAGLRIWCGATVEASDLEALMPWLDWAYEQVA